MEARNKERKYKGNEKKEKRQNLKCSGLIHDWDGLFEYVENKVMILFINNIRVLCGKGYNTLNGQ